MTSSKDDGSACFILMQQNGFFQCGVCTSQPRGSAVAFLIPVSVLAVLFSILPRFANDVGKPPVLRRGTHTHPYTNHPPHARQNIGIQYPLPRTTIIVASERQPALLSFLSFSDVSPRQTEFPFPEVYCKLCRDFQPTLTSASLA